MAWHHPIAYFTKAVNPRLAKRPLVFNGHLANRGLTSLVNEATDDKPLCEPMMVSLPTRMRHSASTSWNKKRYKISDHGHFLNCMSAVFSYSIAMTSSAATELCRCSINVLKTCNYRHCSIKGQIDQYSNKLRYLVTINHIMICFIVIWIVRLSILCMCVGINHSKEAIAFICIVTPMLKLTHAPSRRLPVVQCSLGHIIGIVFYQTQFQWHDKNVLGNWRCCLILEVVSLIPLGPRQFVRFLVVLYALSCARASKSNLQIVLWYTHAMEIWYVLLLLIVRLSINDAGHSNSSCYVKTFVAVY